MVAVRLVLGGAISEPLLIKRSSSNTIVRLSMPGRGNLRIAPSQAVDVKADARGPWAQFFEERMTSGIRFKSVGHQNLKGASIFLKATPTLEGGLAFGASEGDADASVFEIVSEDASPAHAECVDRRPPPPSPPAFTLTPEHKAIFIADGVLVLRGLVQRSLVDGALRTINSSLPLASAWEQDEDGGATLKFGKGIAHQRAIQDLLAASPLQSVAEQLLGRLDRSDGFGGQLALRWPLADGVSEARAPKPDDQWHIDGMKKSPEHMSPFQLLAGVALSDQPADDCGNVHVWRGQHQRTFDAVCAQREARQRRALDGTSLAAEGDPWLGHKPALPPEARVQHRLQAGDVILAHQKLPHAVGLNRSPNVRYQVYFRLRGAGFRPEESLTSLWHGWQGLADKAAPATAKPSMADGMVVD